MPPNDMSFQPFQKKTSSKFPPPKKKQQKHVCPNLLSGPFSNPKNIKKKSQKTLKALMPERSLLLKAIEDMDDDTLKPEKVSGR